jgi:tetratricopeptide (TPR) repeat protein
VAVFLQEIMAMLAPLPSIEAFRRDAISIDGVELDDGVTAAWLESATRLERAAMSRGSERERLLSGLLARHDVVTFPAALVSITALVDAVMSVATEMEDGACFRMAHSVLSTLLIVVPENEALLRGRVLAQQGRIARHLGEHWAAARYYEEVERLGLEQHLAELTGRAWVGFGILAQFRGDFPEGRRRFSAVTELKGASSESVCIAHHHLMIAAAAARDYDTAATHAWRAFKDASTAIQETEALINLAQLLLDAGHPRAALRGFAAALARNLVPRFALPTLGGAACAAATALPRPAARALIRNFAERVQSIVTSLRNGDSLPFPSTSALVETSEALAYVGDPQASEEIAARATALASNHGFHQLSYRLENPVHVRTPEPATASPSTHAIIAAIDELEGAELVGAAW